MRGLDRDPGRDFGRRRVPRQWRDGRLLRVELSRLRDRRRRVRDLLLAHLELWQRRADGLGVRRQLVGARLQLRLGLQHDRLLVALRLAVGIVARGLAGDVIGAGALERLVRRHAAEAGARQRRVRAALAVRENRGAAAGQLLLGAAAAERDVGLRLRELGVGLDVDLPAGEARREPGVHPFLADCERELVVGDDDRRLLALVVEVHLADAGRRERLRDEARGLRVPRDDVDLLAAELGNDHAHARAARADARADRVDALRMRLDRDLRAVAGLAGDAADVDETVGDLGHLELEQRLDQLRVAARQDDLRALRAGADLGDDGLDARALLVALTVDLLGAREQRLDLAEVDEDVVAVAGLLDDAGDDLADAVDVLVVHHAPLLLADALEDDLLRRLRGDAPEALRGHVLARDPVLGHLGPVDVEVVVRDQGVLALARLLLEALEL